MRILLVRHGESQSNCDTKLHTLIPDHEISLSSRGIEQAEYAGHCLKAYFDKQYADLYDDKIPVKDKAEKQLNDLLGTFKGFGENSDLKRSMKDLLSKFNMNDESLLNEIKPKIKLYNSPYRRTRETAKLILKEMKPLIHEVKEDVLLCEEQHGLFDGLEDDEQEKMFPEEFKLFKKTERHNGKFWARYPHGESPFDVAIRLRQFFQSLKEDEENGVKDVILVAHVITIKVFAMAWLNRSPEWYETEKSPGNCAIRILEDNKDLGYIFGGHRQGQEWKYEGNANSKKKQPVGDLKFTR